MALSGSHASMAVVEETTAARALLHPMRRRVLEHLAQPDSASGVAKKLGMSRQRVNYHLRALQAAGLVEPIEERRRGNCVERLVRATATSYVISPAALGALGRAADHVGDQLSAAYLIARAARTVRQVSALHGQAQQAGKRLGTLTLDTRVRFANAATRKAFLEELARTVAVLVARYHDERASHGRWMELVVSAYPQLDEEPSPHVQANP